MKYLNSIVGETEQIRLDIGCGLYPKKGFIGIDNFVGIQSQTLENIENYEKEGTIIKHDLNMGIPFATDSVSEVVTSHFLEHADDVSFILKEVHRILKPESLFEIILPYANSAEGLYPGHKVFFTEKWFLENLLFKHLFRVEKMVFFETEFYKNSKKRINKIFTFEEARTFLFNCCNQFQIFCYAKKGCSENQAELQRDIEIISIPFQRN